MFLHEVEGWAEYLTTVASEANTTPAFVEKDYWVTHTLWALHQSGLGVWFKGGTSLSKGFGIIERFSEDLDLALDGGGVGIPQPIRSKKNYKQPAIDERRAWFEAVAARVDVPGCELRPSPTQDARAQSYDIEVHYPSLHAATLPGAMTPYVRLEIGWARVTPCVDRVLNSWAHRFAEKRDLLEGFRDTRQTVRCLHPWVTCMEKLDALQRRFTGQREPSSYVRHYEDIARILYVAGVLPPIGEGIDGVDALAARLRADDRLVLPSARSPAFTSATTEQWSALQQAWRDIAPMYWGERVTLEDACAAIRSFLAGLSR